MVQFYIRDHQVVDAPQTEVAQFAVEVFKRPIAITTVAVADHVMIDLLNHEVHWRGTCHDQEFAANRVLPFFCGCLRCEVFALPTEGIEPTLTCVNWILSPARLPIPPRRLS